jgi:hypothetical protein
MRAADWVPVGGDPLADSAGWSVPGVAHVMAATTNRAADDER